MPHNLVQDVVLDFVGECEFLPNLSLHLMHAFFLRKHPIGNLRSGVKDGGRGVAAPWLRLEEVQYPNSVNFLEIRAYKNYYSVVEHHFIF